MKLNHAFTFSLHQRTCNIPRFLALKDSLIQQAVTRLRMPGLWTTLSKHALDLFQHLATFFRIREKGLD
jgi:hypothetical protein